MEFQIIIFLALSFFFALIAFSIYHQKSNIIKYSRFKYLSKGILFIIFGSILLAATIIGCYFMFSEFITGEASISGDIKSINLVKYTLIIMIILSFYFLNRGISSIKAVSMKDVIKGNPERMEFPLNVSRLKFLYAVMLNPFEISVNTVFAFLILFYAVFFMFYSSDYDYLLSKKIIMLLIALFIQFGVNIFALLQYNRLYTNMKKGNIYTIVSEQGISRKTQNLLINTTPWDKVEAVKFFKDYVSILAKDDYYWIFTKNEAERNNIKLFYQQSRCYGNLSDKHDATFVEIEEQLKNMVSNSLVFYADENFKLYPHSSKGGGNPFVPENFAYEYPAFYLDNDNNEKRPFVFLAQINCKHVYKYDKVGLLPKSGILYFFCDIESNLGYVYYYNGDLKCLKELDLPENIPFTLNEYGLKIFNEPTLPCYEDFALMVNNGYFYDVESYYMTLNSVYESLKVPERQEPKLIQMLGYADLVNNSILEEAIINDKHLSVDDFDEIQNDAKEWLLLFQISLGDEGMCFFYIKRNDLEIKNFDNIYFTIKEV